MIMIKRIHIFIFMALLIAACGGGNQEAESDTQSKGAVEKVKGPERIVSNPAQSDTLKPLQNSIPGIVGHGKVKAKRYADISFQMQLPIKGVYVRNGMQVRKGQKIAELDAYQLNNAVSQAQKSLEQTRLEMQDVIISQGYDPQKMNKVPDRVKQLAEVKSGYKLKVTQLEAAQHDLTKAVIIAPFDGVVANVKTGAYSLAQPGEAICRIIDNKEMKVEFKVMEQDLKKVKNGTRVTAVPFYDNSLTYEGQVYSINPIVDEQGAVTVKAVIQGGAGLYDGMNVNITVE